MRVKLLRSFFLLPILLFPAFGQLDRVELTNNTPGRAEAKVAGMILRADEATLNHDTGNLVMRGHVHVMLPAREDHTVVRYGTGVLLTIQPIGLTADRVRVKNGLLEAAGGIVIVPADPELPKVQLRGDELWMLLKIGDATLKGNVRASGIARPSVDPLPPFRNPERIFPPDIVKQ
jgi:hypothetical protein